MTFKGTHLPDDARQLGMLAADRHHAPQTTGLSLPLIVTELVTTPAAA